MNDLGLADFQQPGLVFNRHAFRRAARVTNEGGVFSVCAGEHHVHELVLVLRRHGDDVRHTAQIGNVEHTVVRRAVVGRQSGTIHAKNDRQVLQRSIVDDAIVSALKKSGINRADGMKSHRRHAAGEQDSVLFSNAHIVVAVWHRLFQRLQTSAARHRRGDADDRVVLPAKLHHGFTENILPVWWRARLGRRCRAGRHIIGPGAVKLLRLIDGDVVAFPLFRQDMDYHRLVAFLGELEHVDEEWKIVTVHGTEIAQSHFLEDQTVAVTAAPIGFDLGPGRTQADFSHCTLKTLFGLVGEFQGDLAFRQSANEPLEIAVPAVVGRVRDQLVEIGGNRADILGDTPLVVVENPNEPFGGVSDVVQRLERNAIRQRGVAEDGHDVFITAALVAGGANPQGGGQCRASVSGTVTIVLALGAQGVAVQTIGQANGVKKVLPPGQ